MFDLQVPDHIIRHARDLLKRHNFGKRGVADGNYSEQLTGLIGQCVILELFDLPLMTGEKGFDNGEDLQIAEKAIDVKTMGRTTRVRDYYVNNFIGLQKDYQTDVYIFCSLNKKTKLLTVCGWVTKKQLFERAQFFKKGTRRFRSDGSFFITKADLYEIKNSDLNPVNSVEELKTAMQTTGVAPG